jgi:uncharacterized membrane protein YkvI
VSEQNHAAINRKILTTLAFQKSAVAAALKTSLIVGVILNLINQGDHLITFDVKEIDIPKFLLTFLVPFTVSLYSSTTTKFKFYTGELAFVDATLVCKKCKTTEQRVRAGERIETCSRCNKKTKWKPLAIFLK